MIRIIIADDHVLVRKSIIEYLRKISDIEVINEAGNGKELLSLIIKHDCDVILLDINMPGRDGLEVILDILKFKPEISILVVSFHKDSQYVLKAFARGALGYISKDSSPDELIGAIRKVYTKEKYIDTKIAGNVIFQLAEFSAKERKHEELSHREFEVLLKIGNGKSMTEIAEELNLSVKSISTYRKRLLEKLEMQTNLDLIKYVVKNDLV
jgi:two-component system, NarL family, invasion response regulator UvrY